MSWTYLGVPGTGSEQERRDAVRLLIKDTNEDRELLQDEEIDFFLSENGNHVWRAAADACRGLAAREAKSKSVGDLSLSGMGETWTDLAKRYDMRADSSAVPFAGGISVADKETRVADTDRVQPAFGRGLHDTPGLASTGST